MSVTILRTPPPSFNQSTLMNLRDAVLPVDTETVFSDICIHLEGLVSVSNIKEEPVIDTVLSVRVDTNQLLPILMIFRQSRS